MIKVDNRESAHLRSRVEDLSVVPNVASFNGLFACLTPISKISKNEDNLYEPILVRDTDTLIANFGDPRIDPEKYVDLYTIMQIIANGGTAYVAKVNAGDAGIYHLPFAGLVPVPKIEGKEATQDGATAKWTVSGLDSDKYEIVSVEGSSEDDGLDDSKVFFTDSWDTDEESDGTESGSAEAATIKEYKYKATEESGLFTTESSGKYKLGITLVDDAGSDLTDNLPSKLRITLAPKKDEAFTAITLNKDTSAAADDKIYTTTVSKQFVINSIGRRDSSTADKGYSTSWENLGNGKWKLTVTFNEAPINPKITSLTEYATSIVAYSAMTEDLDFVCSLTKAKPYSLNVYYLNVSVKSGGNTLASAKIKIDDDTTTNKTIINNLNSSLGTIARFELLDPTTEEACGRIDDGAGSIAHLILTQYAKKAQDENGTTALMNEVVVNNPNFEVSVDDYIDALKQYKAKKYTGCIMADLACPVNTTKDTDGLSASSPEGTETGKYYLDGKSGTGTDKSAKPVAPISGYDRRSLHFYMKDIARERKDTTVFLSTPYYNKYMNNTVMTQSEVCDWVASQGSFKDLWEYGQGATTDYATQSFYLEIYDSWLEMQCTKIVNGAAKSVSVKVPPAGLVVNNVLKSWRKRGVQYPVAGDQFGTLPETCTILKNPATKLDRDQLVQYRINPIYDTGTRGIQIYGNETLNAGYTDLNAAHIARTLVYIRSTVDEYTETLKFSINNMILWDKWKAYVAQKILDPLVSANAVKEYRVAMGEDTTSPAEIANRTINGLVQLIFYQSAEIFDLTYTIYSTSTTIDEAMATD